MSQNDETCCLVMNAASFRVEMINKYGCGGSLMNDKIPPSPRCRATHCPHNKRLGSVSGYLSEYSMTVLPEAIADVLHQVCRSTLIVVSETLTGLRYVDYIL